LEQVESFQIVIKASTTCTLDIIGDKHQVAFMVGLVVSGHIVDYVQVPFRLYDLLYVGRLCHLCFILCSCHQHHLYCYIGLASFIIIILEDLEGILPSLVAD
jgi:hypothetical protein